MSESQRKILIPDPEVSEDEEVKVKETTSKKYNCLQCKRTFTNVKDHNKYVKLTHVADNNSAGDHKCQECSYRTNFAANYLLHMLNTHSSNEFARTIKSLKPVDSALVYMLAEQNMALAVETRLMRKDLNYIKEALKPKSQAERFKCQKCKDLCASPTRMQEHMLEDHCCKYCDKVFASRTEKEKHKKYMCITCEFIFSHSIELNIHTRTFHRDTPELLQYHCTECSHEEKTEESIVKHIETKHSTILSPAKICQPAPAPCSRKLIKCTECSYQGELEEDVIRHIETKHLTVLGEEEEGEIRTTHISGSIKVTKPTPAPRREKPAPPPPKNNPVYHCTQCDATFNNEKQLKAHIDTNHNNRGCYDCHKCGHKAQSQHMLAKHKEIKHSRYMNLPNWFIVGDSHLNSIKPRIVEKATGGKLFGKGFNHPKEGRAYCSSKDWPNSKFPSNNHTDIIPKLLTERVNKGGIILCPGNDISNVASMSRAKQFAMAEQSVLNMVGAAEKALTDNTTLQKLVMMEYPPRADNKQLAEVTKFANEVLNGVVNKSKHKEKIKVGSLQNPQYNNNKEMVAVFGPEKSHPRYDGVHLRGRQGSWRYTESIVAAVTGVTSITAARQPRQVRHQEVSPVTTHNKYDVLN